MKHNFGRFYPYICEHCGLEADTAIRVHLDECTGSPTWVCPTQHNTHTEGHCDEVFHNATDASNHWRLVHQAQKVM